MTRQRVLVAAGVWFLLVVSLWASGSHPAPLVLAGIVAVAAAAAFALVDVFRDVTLVDWTRPSRRARSGGGDDLRVASLRHQVHGAWWTGSTAISDTLVELVDDRLLTHHHIDRATDPDAAAAVLTPTLRRLLAGPRRQTATATELRLILTDIEAL